MADQDDAKPSGDEPPAAAAAAAATAAAEEEDSSSGGENPRESSKREGEEKASSQGGSDGDAEAKGSGGSGSGDGGKKAKDGDAVSSANKVKGDGGDRDHPEGKPGDSAETKGSGGSGSADGGKAEDGDAAGSAGEEKEKRSDGEDPKGKPRDHTVTNGIDGGESDDDDKAKDSDAAGSAEEKKKDAGDEDHGDAKPGDEAGTKGNDGGGSGGEDATASEGGTKRESKAGADTSKSSDAGGGEKNDDSVAAGSVSEENKEKTDGASGGDEKTGDNIGEDIKKEIDGEEKKAESGGDRLAIDMATVHGATGGVGGDGGKPPSDRGSDESSFFEEEPDELEVDLDKPWEKPSIEHAKKAGKRMIWNNGMRYYFSTSIKEIGSMGVGMYLYFWMVRIVAIMFAYCTIFSIPAMVLNQQGNAGMAISETDMDSLGLVTLSYGNQGLNPDLVVESGCISSNGTVDCTGKTVQVMGEAKDVLWVGYILVGGEAVIAIFFLLFIVVLSERLKAKIDEIDNANVTPGDYSVMVRGLPADVTKEEVRKHFSDLYSLVTPGPSYPFLGVSPTGVGIFWGCTLGVLFGLLAAPSVIEYADLGKGTSAFGMGVIIVFLCVIAVYAVVEGCGIGGPRKRDTPLQEWEKGRKQRAKNNQTVAKKYAAAPGRVLPVETNPDANVSAEGGIAKEFDGSAVAAAAAAAADGDAAEVAKLEEGGIAAGEAGGAEPLSPLVAPGATPTTEEKLAVEEPHRSLVDERPPDPLPCQSCLNTHDKSFIGSWVADVVLGNPVGDVLMGFMDQEANFEKIGKARTVVRQMKTLGKAKKLAKAEAKLAKLKAKEEALMTATRKKQDPAALDAISVAFVTFEHEESKKRCLEDYRYSRRGFCRRFQPAKLQFSRMPAEEQAEQASSGSGGRRKKPRPRRWRLKVFEAPEPSDVKWENLDVTPNSRKLRRAFTSLVCVVLLVVSFVIIYLAQTEQVKLQEQIPALETCEEAIPAVIFGTYEFPPDAALQRNDALDSTCAEDSFYLAFSASNVELDYNNLPPVFSADGTSMPRDAFESTENANLCDDPCQPISGGRTCRALSCYERSWEGRGYDCASYSQSTMVGCFCLNAVITSFQENGLLEGAKVVADEQGAVCAPFLKDYATANAIKILAVLSVVIVNTLLTSVMEKLARFERHVSLSDYTSTVTAKLALAQFLNTALIVVIVNAGYTGGGLGFLQDFGVLGGEYKDFERSWYATVGVAVAMTTLINVVVPHATTLVGELIVKPVKRLFKRRSVATQAEMNSLYKPPKFLMESRYAFLLQVLGVSLLYAGGIPVLYLFACFSFATNFIVDKLWIIKLSQQPPMYTASLAKMFVGVLPLALLMHMSTATYMLGNADILDIGFVSEEARAIAEALDGQGMSGLVADHVLRKHVFPLFVLTALFIALYVIYKIVGDPVLQLVKLVFRVLFNVLFGWMCKRKTKSITDEQGQTPGYTAEFFRLLKKGEKIEADETKMGWVEGVENGKRVAKWICAEDGPGPRGVKYKAGVPRQTWQVIAELGQYNYAMEESDEAGKATRYMATAGFLSPRMKEKQQAKLKKLERFETAKKGEEKQSNGPAGTTGEEEEKLADSAENRQDRSAAPAGGAEEKPRTASSSGEEKTPPDEGKNKQEGLSAPAGGETESTAKVDKAAEEEKPADAAPPVGEQQEKPAVPASSQDPDKDNPAPDSEKKGTDTTKRDSKPDDMTSEKATPAENNKDGDKDVAPSDSRKSSSSADDKKDTPSSGAGEDDATKSKEVGVETEQKELPDVKPGTDGEKSKEESADNSTPKGAGNSEQPEESADKTSPKDEAGDDPAPKSGGD